MPSKLKFDSNHNRHYRASHFTEEGSYRMRDLLPSKLPSWSWERWFFVGSAAGSISVGIFLGFWYQDWMAVLPGVGMSLLSSLLAVMIDWDEEDLQ